MASASRALHLARLSAPLRGGAVSSRPLRPIAAAAGSLLPSAPSPFPSARPRLFATQAATSSLRDSSPNWSNRPPKETILLDGCDFEHWLVVMEPPPGDPGNPDAIREDIIATYISTLAKVVGSEEEARQKIYSVSTRHYFAFGALVSEELSYKIKELPNVRWVLPDSYLDVKNKDYGGEPFINGVAVPYDPKYHEEWVRNNERAKNRRNDRPRMSDRSTRVTADRRRENMQNFQNRDVRPGQGFNNSPLPGQHPMPPRGAPPMHHAQGNMAPPPPPNVGAPPSYQPHAPNYQQGGGAPGGLPGHQGSPVGNMHGGSDPVYQSSNPRYQGGVPGYQGSNPPPPFQGGGQPLYGGSNPPPPYQGSGHSYGSGAPGYEGRDGPRRNYQ
ncbi:unnamed protein product [Urochloa humidicola]